MSSLSTSVGIREKIGRIAVLTINYPPVNALGRQVKEVLVESLAAVAADDSIDALVIRCDGRTYFAGADIKEFGKPPTPPNLPDLIEQVERCAKPVITAIHGSALGGGLELAMACHFRLATPTAKLGLPEVNLGILPGAGGTQRLPRLIGIEKALGMLTSGRPIGATEALELGLIDAIIDGDIAQQAISFAESVVNEGRAIRRTRDRDEKLADVRETLAIIDRFEAKSADKFQHLHAPPAILKAVRGVLDPDFDKGIALERAQFLTLRDGPQAAALRHSFFAEREAAKVPGVSASVRPQPVTTIGIVGATATGTEIATNFVSVGCAVCLVETSEEALDRGVSSIHETLDQNVIAGRMSKEVATQAKEFLRPTLELKALSEADFIVEASHGSAADKQSIFALLDEIAKPAAILAVQISRPDVADVAAVTTRPGHVLGLHFFSPGNATKNATKIVEVVRGEKTSDVTLVSTIALVKRIGKTPVIAGNANGFIGDRMLAVMQAQAESMIRNGVSLSEIDRVAKAFGMPIRPFRVSDMADVAVASTRPIDEAEILTRLHYPLINEGARILQEGLALRASDIDVVWINACGWPAWTGGPMFYADRIGLQSIAIGLDRLNVEPAALLSRLVAEQKNFADFDAKIIEGQSS